MVDYSYPDEDEQITGGLVDAVSRGTQYWQASEDLALLFARAAATQHLGASRRRRALDVGCGLGRLIPWLAQLSDDVTAWDPDAARAEHALRAWETRPNNDRNADSTVVRVVSGRRPSLPSKSAELVLCSHVLQHIPASAQSELVSWVSEVAAETAVLMLLFSHDRGAERYVLESVENGERVVTPTDRHGFEAAAAGTSHPEKSTLPVRFLVTDAVSAEFAEHGWLEALRWEFHVTDAEKPSIANDVAANTVPTAMAGRDVLLVMTRGGVR